MPCGVPQPWLADLVLARVFLFRFRGLELGRGRLGFLSARGGVAVSLKARTNQAAPLSPGSTKLRYSYMQVRLPVSQPQPFHVPSKRHRHRPWNPPAVTLSDTTIFGLALGLSIPNPRRSNFRRLVAKDDMQIATLAGSFGVEV